MKKITFLLAILLIILLATNNASAQTDISGKWSVSNIDVKPAAGKEFTLEQAKAATAYKKAMLLRCADVIYDFKESAYALIQTGNQESVEVGTYTTKGKNEFLLTRKVSEGGLESVQHIAKVKGKQLIIEVTNIPTENGFEKLLLTLDR